MAALVFIALRKFRIPVLQWFVEVILVVVVAFVIIVAIKIVASM